MRVWRPLSGKFLKNRTKNSGFKVFLVLEVIGLKQVKVCLTLTSVTFKIMCDITLVTWNELVW